MTHNTLSTNLDRHPGPFVLPQTNSLRAMHTAIRPSNTPQDVFVFNSRRIMRLLMEFALDFLPYDDHEVSTPSGGLYKGHRIAAPICGVSVLRAGDSMEAEFRAVAPKAPIGKILIQRDVETKQPKFYFAKLPNDIAERQVLLLDPMLATGGTAVEAIRQLIDHGVEPESIIFVTLLCVAPGLDKVYTHYPEVRIITSSVEDELNDQAFMVPGIGDFGDRYFGTYVQPTPQSV